MSSAMTFKGRYQFGSKSDLRDAMAAVQEIVDGEEPDLKALYKKQVVAKDTEVTIDIDTSCPSDWFFTLEAVVETLAAAADSGTVESTLEGTDESETYRAGDEEDDDDEDEE